jgi:pimeloyl-ACP methyl ester carboxylesterase
MPFSNKDLLAILNEIFKAGRYTNPTVSLLAYSMGARIALTMLEEIPYHIEKAILMAPDGLQKSFWYSLATQNYLGTRLFHFSMKHPGWLFGLLHVCHKFRFINPGFIKFANYYIHNEQMRNALYNRWMAMRRFRPNIKKIKCSVRQNNIQLRLLYGKYDKIIRYQNAEKFMRVIESYCILSVIETGHQLIQEKNMDAIVRVIKD